MDIPVVLVDLVLVPEPVDPPVAPVVLLTFREASAAQTVLAVLRSHARLMEPPVPEERYALVRRRAVIARRSLEAAKANDYIVDEDRIAEEWSAAQPAEPEP